MHQNRQVNSIGAKKEKHHAAGIVLQCGGKPGQLPVVIRGRDYLNSSSFRRVICNASEIMLFQGEEVRYDEDSDECHPKEFEAAFVVNPEIFLVSGFDPAILKVGSKRWPACAGVTPTTFDQLIRLLLRRTWGSDFGEKRIEAAVGEVNGSEIRREVVVLTRR